MFTVMHQAASGNRAAFYTARIVLASGVIAGEGYAGLAVNALQFAVEDARQGGFIDAANGHAATLEATAKAWPLPASEVGPLHAHAG